MMMKPSAIYFDAYRNQLEVAFEDGACRRIDAQCLHPDKKPCTIVVIQPDALLSIEFDDGRVVEHSWQVLYDLVNAG